MSHLWPFLRDVVYTMSISRWLRFKLIKRRRRLAIKRFADLESGETYFL